MRSIIPSAFCAALTLLPVCRAQEYAIQPLPISAVRIDDGFWTPRIERNRAITIPHILRQNELTGRVANFVKAAHQMPGAYQGRRFNDTDVYKIIEAASDSLISHSDPALDRQLDELIAIVAAAQQSDGYLFPALTIDPLKPAPGVGLQPWVYENGSHELYNSGHLYEAAVAHFLATGKRTLLDVAVRNADLVRKDFGPNARHAAPGHEEIELALVKLYRATGNRDYANLAKFFLDERGKPHDIEPYPDGPFAMYNDRPYKQDQLPVVEQDKAAGHAVRAVYLYSGMTDVAAIFNDSAYKRAIDRIWTDMTSKRMYLTGGIGSRSGTEAFGDDYELPNRRAYTETCASIGNVLWNHRMFLLEGDGRYLDAAEQILYNGMLSGVSLSGDKFFYQNPLESEGNNERSTYFDVACCPANLARSLAQFPSLVYARAGKDLYVNLYVKSRATSETVAISQDTQYPWNGDVQISVDPAKPVDLNLHVRIPGWTRGQIFDGDLYRVAASSGEPPMVRVNGKSMPLKPIKGFVEIQRRWKKGDVVTVHLPMPVLRVLANDGLVADKGRAAIQRGPILYCAEGIDNKGQATQLQLPLSTQLQHSFRPDLLGGVEVITGKVGGAQFMAVPYSLWANRGRGSMAVWLKE